MRKTTYLLIALLISSFSWQINAQTTHNLDWYTGISSGDASLTIDAGDTVIWTFTDGAPHSVTSDTGSNETFDSGTLPASSTYQYTFTEAGVNDYHCEVHPSMVGTITVNAAVTPGVTCDAPIEITSLPYSTSDNTSNYGDDYENGSSPCSSWYMSGDDVIYSYTPANDAVVNVSMTNVGSSWSGIHILDACLDDSPGCVAFVGNSGTSDRLIEDLMLTGGQTYYIVISTWAAPQSTSYDLDIVEITCPNPMEIYTANVTPTSAEVYWMAGSDETEWEVVYGVTGFDPNTEGMTMADDDGTLGVELTGLTPQTQYDVYVKAVCGVDDESEWVGPYTFGDYTALEVTSGYNEDVIANGIGDPQTTTTALVDNDSYAYISVDYQFSASDDPAGFGLPLDGNLSNGPTDGLNYQLADYDVNNVLRMDTAGETNGGTITFNNTFMASNLYIAATSGSGASVLGGTITFDDNTTQDIPDTSVPDWYGGPANMTIISGLGRVNVTNGNTESSSTNPRIYQLAISIDPSNYGKVISSVDLHKESGNGVINIFGASIQFAPDCAEPTDVLVENITSDSADITWTAGNTETEWEILYGEEGFDTETEGTSIQDNDGTIGETLNGLTPNTTYDVYVRSICGVDNESVWVGPITFTTECIAFDSFPYVENFDEVSTPDLPGCWSFLNENADGDFWQTYSTYGLDGSQAAGLYTDFNSGNNNDYLVSPQFTLTGNERVKFSMRVRSSFEPNDFEVLLSTTGKNPEDFTEELFPLTEISNTSYEEYIIDLDEYTGNVYISFHVPSNGPDGWYIYMDNFTIEEIPSCIAPTDLAVSNVTDTTADVSWTAGADEDAWEVIYGMPGFDPMTEGTTLSDDDEVEGIQIDNLTSETEYEVYVRAICAVDDESQWTGPVSFTTDCSPFIPYYLEEFDDYLPNCWMQAGAGNPTTGPSDFGSSLWFADEFLNTGDNDAVNINLYTNNREDWLISPSFDLSGGTYELVYMAALTDYNNSDVPEGNGMGLDDEVQVLISEDNGATWQNLITYNQSNYPSNTGDVQIIDLSSYTGIVKFAFWGTDGSVNDSEDYDFFIDDFEVRTPPSCPQPLSLMVDAVTLTTTDVSWEAGGAEDEWFVIYGEDGFDPLTEGTTVFVSGSPETTLTELSEETDYDFYVVAVCSALDTSDLTGPSSFFTGYCESMPSSNDGTGFTTLELQSTLFTSGGDITYENFTDTPVDAAQGQEVSLIVDLNTGSGYDYDYHVWVDLNDNLEFEDSELMISGETNGDPDEIFDASFTLPADAMIGNHRLRLATADSGQSTPNPCYNGSYGNTADFTLNVIDFCEVPTDVTVTNITDTMADVTWTDNAGTMEWEVIYGPEGFDPMTEGMSMMDNDGVLGVTLTDLDPNMSYDVYVVAVCDVENSSAMSEVETFMTLQEPCEAPTDVTVTNITDTMADISWTDNAGTMEWEVIYGPEGFDPMTEGMSMMDNDGTLGVTLTDLDPESPYDVYVIAICDVDNASEMSLVETFTTETLGLSNSNFIGFNYYPNPVKNVIHLEANNSIDRVLVYDLVGKQILNRTYNNLNAEIDLSMLQAGSYIMTVQIGNQSKTVRILKD